MNKGSKIYISGHRGLVGSAILRGLQAKGYGNLLILTSRELDLRRQAETEAFFARERPDYVFLAAAKVGGILANNTYKADFIYDNLMIASNVISSAHKYGVRKLLNLGSSCIYPRLAPQPLKEEYLLTGPLEPTNEPYAVAKIAAIKLCRYYNEQYGANFISVMPTNLYGPGDNFDLMSSHVLPALIRKCHLARLAQAGDIAGIQRDEARYGPIPQELLESLSLRRSGQGLSFTTEKPKVLIWGTGDPFREFLHVDDLADACIYLMERYDYPLTGECINIGTGKEIRIREIAGLIREITGFEGKIEHDLSKPDGTPRKLLDISRLRALGWEAGIPLSEGLKQTCDWYSDYSSF